MFELDVDGCDLGCSSVIATAPVLGFEFAHLQTYMHPNELFYQQINTMNLFFCNVNHNSGK